MVAFADEVADEREYQRTTWGDDHDDAHEPPEWGLLVLRYAGRVGESLEQCLAGAFEDDDVDVIANVRIGAIKLASVCNALVDRLDRELACREVPSQ